MEGTMPEHTMAFGGNVKPGHDFLCEHPNCVAFWQAVDSARKLADEKEKEKHGGEVQGFLMLKDDRYYSGKCHATAGSGPYWCCGYCSTRLGTKLKEIELGMKCEKCGAVVTEIRVLVVKKLSETQ